MLHGAKLGLKNGDANADAHRSLEWLLSPVTSKQFFDEYWEHKPLVVLRQESGYFAEVLSLKEVDRALTTLDRRYPDVTLKNARREITSDEYTNADGALDIVQLCKLFQDGATITLAYLDTVIPSLGRICRVLETEFNCPFQANVYLTPPRAQGAKPHYDTHDVFVLQISGSKQWTLYGTPVELPLPGQEYDATVHECGPVTNEFELHAGDIAYVPRGVMHEAVSTDETSLHVTIGTLRYTWADLLLDYVAGACLKDPVFRKSLPFGFARTQFDRESAHATLLDLLKRVSAHSDFDQSLDHFIDEFVASCPPLLDGQLAASATLDQITGKSIVGVRPGVAFSIRMQPDSVSVQCDGHTITLPLFADQPVRFALSQPKFEVEDIPGNLDDAGKLTLVRRLVAEGLLVTYL